MFDWKLFTYLILVSLPGILVSIPRLIQILKRTALNQLPPGKEVPTDRVLMIASTAQSLLLVALAAAVGTALAHRVGLRAPFFEALASGAPLWDTLQPQILWGTLLGVGGALIIVAANYLFFRPRLDVATVQGMEKLRMELGLAGRVLYGGIVEEVLFRWGVMSLLVWLGARLLGDPSPALIWGVIVGSGLLFGLGHLPSYLMAGCRKTPLFVTFMLTINLWATLICGWLFWQYGLLAAMIAHTLYHLVWLPFDLHFYAKSTASVAG
jgi:hypothetical protein